MPEKQPTHRSILVLIPTYDDIQAIIEQLSAEKNVPVTGPIAMKLIVDHWKQTHSELTK